MRRKTKNTLKTVGMTVLGLALIVGAGAGINKLVNESEEDLKVIHPVFSVGGLNEETGKYEISDSTIYTKEAFECLGLEVKLDFEDAISYEVFFYDNTGKFISSTGLLEDAEEIKRPAYGTHARIEITPDWEVLGEDYEDKENQVIKWYEVSKYSSQMEIKVSEDQTFTLDGLDQFAVFKTDYSAGNTLDNPTSNNGKSVSKPIEVKSGDTLTIKYATEVEKFVAITTYDEDGNKIEQLTVDDSEIVKSGNKNVYMDTIGEGVCYVVLTFYNNGVFEIIVNE